jgi:hypothetical protein
MLSRAKRPRPRISTQRICTRLDERNRASRFALAPDGSRRVWLPPPHRHLLVSAPRPLLRDRRLAHLPHSGMDRLPANRPIGSAGDLPLARLVGEAVADAKLHGENGVRLIRVTGLRRPRWLRWPPGLGLLRSTHAVVPGLNAAEFSLHQSKSTFEGIREAIRSRTSICLSPVGKWIWMRSNVEEVAARRP